MPTITCNTGILAGRTFDNLLDLMDAQDEARRVCQHTPTLRQGICGKGIRKRSWQRIACTKCQAVLTDNVFTEIPDYEEEKQMVSEFWKTYRLAGEGEIPYWWVVLRYVPRVGIAPEGASGAMTEHQARKELREQLGCEGKGLGGKLVAVVKISGNKKPAD